MPKDGGKDTLRDPGRDPARDVVGALEALLAAVTAEARANPAFARRLAKALKDPRALADSSARAPAQRDAWRAEAPGIDLAALYTAGGAEGVRRALRPLTRRQVYALVRVQRLDPEGTSALTKAQLIEHAARALKRTLTPRKRVLDY